MKYPYHVKHNGVMYAPGEDVPEEKVGETTGETAEETTEETTEETADEKKKSGRRG